MADNDQRSSENQDWAAYPSKIMQNIFIESKDVTRHIKSLEFISENLDVAASRILIAGGIAGLLIIFVVWMISSYINAIAYIGIPLLLLLPGAGIILLFYLFTNHKRPLLVLILQYLSFKRIEHRHRKDKFTLKNAGIYSVRNDGLIEFSDGRFGRLYDIEGHVTKTMLPQTIVAVRHALLNYYATRMVTTQEKLITRIERAKPKEQMNELKRLIDSQDTTTWSGAWNKVMANMEYQYVDDYINNKEYYIRQYLIVSEDDEMSMNKADDKLVSSVRSDHIYSKFVSINDAQGVINRLKGLRIYGN